MLRAPAKELRRRLCLYCFLLASLVSLSGCDAALPEPRSAEQVRKQCPGASHEEFYFTSGTVIPADAAQDRQQRDAYSFFLRQANAGSLSCGDSPAEAYRILFWEYPAATVIEVARGGGPSWELKASVFKHQRTETNEWSVDNRIQHRIADDDVRRLADSLTDARFWTRPAWQSYSGEGGGAWFVEARVTSAYRVVSMTPPVQEDFYEAARQFFALAQLDAPKAILPR